MSNILHRLEESSIECLKNGGDMEEIPIKGIKYLYLQQDLLIKIKRLKNEKLMFNVLCLNRFNCLYETLIWPYYDSSDCDGPNIALDKYEVMGIYPIPFEKMITNIKRIVA